MKNLIVEKTEVKLNDEDKIKNFIEESKSNDGVIIKIKNNVYRHLIDKDGRCFTKNITPIFEFTSEDELETILKTQMKNKEIQQAEECSMTNLIDRLTTMYPLVSSNLDTNVDFGEKVPNIFQQYQSAFKKHDITMDTWHTKNDTFYYTLEYYKDGDAYLYRSEEESNFYFEQTAQMACIEKAFEIRNKKIFELIPNNNINTSNKYVDESTTEKENPLKRPSAHSLIDIFKELKFGRPAADQKYLAKCIAELEQVDEDTDYEDTDYEDTDCGPVLTINKNSIESQLNTELEEQPPNYITKTIKSFVSVGDVIEVEHHGKNVIYRVDQFEVIPNSPELRPIDFVILVTFSSSHGGSITCTSNNFKYIRHMNIDKDWCSYEEPHLDYSSAEKLPNVTLNSLVEKGEEELIQGMDKTIIDSSKLRPYNRINVLSSQEGKMSMDDLEEELTKIVFKYASSHMMKKDLELSIKIMGDVIRHPQFYLNI